MKTCIVCNELKPYSDFHKNKTKKDGLQSSCKICRTKKYLEHKDEICDYKKEWYLKNSEKILEEKKINYLNNKVEISEKRRKKYSEDISHKNLILEKNKNNYVKNKEKYRKTQKNWVENNKEKYRQIQKNFYYKNLPNIICRRILKRTINYLKSQKNGKTIEILGYTPVELKENLEKKFLNGMSWENHGEWHVDHIKPISSFPKDTHPSVINSLNNLQPLWAKDNLSKGSKILLTNSK